LNTTGNITIHWRNVIPTRLFIVLSLILGSLVMAQSPPQRLYGQFDARAEEQPSLEITSTDLRYEGIPLERQIDPDVYRLGPGDQLGIDIVATENFLFTVTVTPAGDILVPTVGIIPVAGMTLSQVRDKIKTEVEQQYRNARVSVTLLQIRRFLIQVQGAVQKPGFATVTPLDRLTTALEQLGGLHKYAAEEQVVIKHADGTETPISLKEFLLTGDLTHNPTLEEGDVVIIPFTNGFQSHRDQYTTLRETAVMVTGFVRYPGSYRYRLHSTGLFGIGRRCLGNGSNPQDIHSAG
jgi:protein involved in polysaccharide export with SLBB domain